MSTLNWAHSLGNFSLLPEILLWVPGGLPNRQSYPETCHGPPGLTANSRWEFPQFSVPAFRLCSLPGVSARPPPAPSS